MTGQKRHIRHAGTAVRAYLTDAFKEVLQMIDLLIEGVVVALSWVGRGFTKLWRCRTCKERPLQVMRAMSMVNDHVLRDVGLDRSAIGTISELSTEEIHGYRTEREVS